MNDTRVKKRRTRHAEQRRDGWWRARIGALNKVFGGQRRYGDGKLYQFSDDDAGREDLRILLDHYAYANPSAIPRVIKARAPWLMETEREGLMVQAGRRPRYWTSPALAQALRLTEAERVALGGVPTIGADITAEERKALRRRRNAERMRHRHRAANVRARTDYLAAHSISRDKPWKAAGISRATWYRRRDQAIETGLCAVNLPTAAHTLVSRQKTKPRARRSLATARFGGARFASGFQNLHGERRKAETLRPTHRQAALLSRNRRGEGCEASSETQRPCQRQGRTVNEQKEAA